MVRFRACAVKGCEDKDSSRHSFPDYQKNPELFNKWVRACKNDELNTLPPDSICKNKKVCHKHFAAGDVLLNVKLKRDAFPTLFLPLDRELTIAGSSSCTPSEENVEEEVLLVEEKSDSENVTLSELAEPEQGDSTPPQITAGTSQEVPYIAAEYEPTPGTSTASTGDVEPSTSGMSVSSDSRKRKREGVLEDIGLRRAADLTPKASKLYSRTKVLSQKIRRLKKSSGELRNKLKLMDTDEILNVTLQPLQEHIRTFIRSQLNMARRDPRGRRFSTDDKIMALVLQKQSGRAYRCLSKLFTLPSRKTLMAMLNRIPVAPGINETIFRNVKLNVSFLDEKQKFCLLMFDEMALEPHLHFDGSEGSVEGFENYGDFTSSQIADHALVFIVKGIKVEWKQPIMYAFCRDSVSKIHLVRLIKSVVQRCMAAGLTVVATVCDQASTNQAAVNYLMQTSVPDHTSYPEQKFFVIEGKRIVHIYDPPHLIKGIRNNLLTKNLVWEMSGARHVARWKDVYQAYLIDNMSAELRTMPKLTEAHCNPRKIKKMKVSCATQVFSHTVASVINLFTRLGAVSPDGQQLEASATGTAKLLKFFDSVFDSVNGHSLFVKGGKKLRCAVSADSPHLSFWQDAKRSLKEMYFQKEGTAEKAIPPSLKNWVITLNGLEAIYHTLKDQGFSYVKPRVFNQDPIENFFGQMRQQGGQNTNPSPTMFRHHFKTLLLNNLVTRHSLSANCEEDSSVLLGVRNFITQGVPEEYDIPPEALDIDVPDRVYTRVDELSLGYVGGFVTNNFPPLYKCNVCKVNLLASERSEWHLLVAEKEFEKQVPEKLKYCAPEVFRGLCTAYNIIMFVLNSCSHEKFVVNKILQLLKEKIDFRFKHTCNAHNAESIILKKFLKLVTYNYVNGVNKILRGNDERSVRGEVAQQARSYYIKRRKK